MKSIDSNGGDLEEASVPQPFEYYETEDSIQSNRDRHTNAPLPELYGIEDVPEDLNTLPPLEYYPLDPEVDPVRLLVVLPHFGNSSSIVQCNLFPVSLSQHHYCFAAIKNTRGNKDIRTNIIINSQIKSITRNLEVCLRRSRHENVAIVLWIREICIDAVDYNCHISPLWRDEIFKRACKLLDMSDFMYSLEQKGLLDNEKIIRSDQKTGTSQIEITISRLISQSP